MEKGREERRDQVGLNGVFRARVQELECKAHSSWVARRGEIGCRARGIGLTTQRPCERSSEIHSPSPSAKSCPPSTTPACGFSRCRQYFLFRRSGRTDMPTSARAEIFLVSSA